MKPLLLKMDKGTGTGKRRADLKGRIVGDLTVGNRAPNKNGQVRYHCTCTCGRKVIRYLNSLIQAPNQCSPSMHRNDPL